MFYVLYLFFTRYIFFAHLLVNFFWHIRSFHFCSNGYLCTYYLWKIVLILFCYQFVSCWWNPLIPYPTIINTTYTLYIVPYSIIIIWNLYIVHSLFSNHHYGQPIHCIQFPIQPLLMQPIYIVYNFIYSHHWAYSGFVFLLSSIIL